jgi:hypothetical protein
MARVHAKPIARPIILRAVWLLPLIRLRVMSLRFNFIDCYVVQNITYSYLSAFTGFLVAARQLCRLTVNNAITKANIPDRIKIHQLSPVL